MNIRKHRRSLIAGAALVAVALVALPAAARSWHGLWNNENETGVLVASVDPDGPAAGAGLQRGDLIVGVDGAEIGGRSDFLAAISDNGVDDTLQFEVRRGNDRIDLTATVGTINGNPYLGILFGPDAPGSCLPSSCATATSVASATFAITVLPPWRRETRAAELLAGRYGCAAEHTNGSSEEDYHEHSQTQTFPDRGGGTRRRVLYIALVALPAAARSWHGLWNNENETGVLVASVDPDAPYGRMRFVLGLICHLAPCYWV